MEISNFDNSKQTKSLFVSIVGRPNVGKSSLMNMIINSKVSIVSPKPQTTRGRILGILTSEDTQIVFTDTPGLYKPKSKLDKYMVSEISSSFSGAEACIHVVEARKKITDFDFELIKKFEKLKIPVVLMINKIDLISDKSLLISQIKEFSDLFKYSAIIPVSSKTGEGREETIEELKKLAHNSVFFFPEDDITDQSERMMTSEIIREKLLRLLNQELPHGTAVVIESFHTRDDGITDISATIYCEKENHKRMIIGKGGSMLKKIGSSARIELEQILCRKINLKIWVKIKENWRNSDFLLNNLGYSIENKLK